MKVLVVLKFGAQDKPQGFAFGVLRLWYSHPWGLGDLERWGFWFSDCLLDSCVRGLRFYGCKG